MLEMRETAPGRVEMWSDGVSAGGAQWVYGELKAGRERVKTAQLQGFQASGEDVEPLRAYLDFLWKSAGVAAVEELDGRRTWFSKGLQKRFETAEGLW